MQPEVKVPESVAALVWRVLEKAPADRPASAEQMIAELDAAEASARVLESGVRPSLSARRGGAPRWTGAVLLGGALGLALLLALLLLVPRRRPAVVEHAAPATAVGPRQAEGATSLEALARSSVSTLENSALAPPAQAAPNASSTPTPKKGTHQHAKPALQKKGNERYGRFD